MYTSCPIFSVLFILFTLLCAVFFFLFYAQHRIYNVSRGLIITYALLYGAFAFDKGDGLQQHHVLLSWVLSLLAQFKSRPSIIWLGLCTGVFMQGFGSYRLR